MGRDRLSRCIAYACRVSVGVLVIISRRVRSLESNGNNEIPDNITIFLNPKSMVNDWQTDNRTPSAFPKSHEMPLISL